MRTRASPPSGADCREISPSSKDFRSRFTVSNGVNTSTAAAVTINFAAPTLATVSGNVGVSWGISGSTTLQTNTDGLRLLPMGRSTWPRRSSGSA